MKKCPVCDVDENHSNIATVRKQTYTEHTIKMCLNCGSIYDLHGVLIRGSRILGSREYIP